MDFETVITEVRNWTAQERLRLIEEVWDDLSDDEQPTELSEELKQLLDHRIEKLERNPDAVVAWEVIEARALRRYRT